MQYLEAMGIDMFVPRKQLLGAKPAQLLPRAKPVVALVDTPAALQQPPAPAVETRATPAAHPQRASHLAMGLVEQLRQPTAAPSPTPQAATAPAEPAKAVRFTLNIWSCPGWLAIDAHQPQLALPTASLLHNLFWSLGSPQPLGKAETLHWPLVETANPATGWQAPQEMMGLFLQQRLQQQPARLLLFGAAAYYACVPGAKDYAQAVFSAITLERLNCRALVLPSLSQLLKTPELKGQLWALLKTQRVIHAR